MGTMARKKIFDAEVVNATATVSSVAVDVTDSTGDFAVGLKGAGTCDVKVEYKVSQDGTNYDTTTTSPSRTILSTISTNYLVTQFTPPPCKWIKIVLTGQGSNATNATVTGHLMYDEG